MSDVLRDVCREHQRRQLFNNLCLRALAEVGAARSCAGRDRGARDFDHGPSVAGGPCHDAPLRRAGSWHPTQWNHLKPARMSLARLLHRLLVVARTVRRSLLQPAIVACAYALGACSSAGGNGPSTGGSKTPDGSAGESTRCDPNLADYCQTPTCPTWDDLLAFVCLDLSDGFSLDGMAGRCGDFYVYSPYATDSTLIEYFDVTTGQLVGVYKKYAVTNESSCFGMIPSPSCINRVPAICPTPDAGADTVDAQTNTEASAD